MKPTYKFTVVADPHYYDASLGVTGESYALRSGSDQKCLAETGALLDAAFRKLAASDTQAVLIAGDLTNDGERVCHEKMLEKLRALRLKKPVYVTTATHDWCCDQNPRRFDGDKVYHDVETVSSEELYTLYDDFGTGAARDRFVTHLGTASYLADLSEDVVLLALNDDQNGKGRAGYTPAHLDWIRKTIRRESENGKTVIAMQHHLLYPHLSPLLTEHACCGDHEELLRLLSEAGLRFLFVGHSHLQRIDRYVSPKGRELYEINVGALCGYPAPMVEVTLTEDSVSIDTVHPDTFCYGGTTYDVQSYLAIHAVHMLGGLLDVLAHGTREQAAKGLAAFNIRNSEAIVRRYGALLRKASMIVQTTTLGRVGKHLNRLPGGPFFDKSDLRALEKVPLTDTVYAFFLSALSGEPVETGQSAAYTRVLRAAAGIPRICLGKCGKKAAAVGEELERALCEILTGGELDNNHLTVKRRQI